jgi:hypothetical protein
VAISFANDSDSKALAANYGAATLLDKTILYTEVLPAIRQCHPELFLPNEPHKQATQAP